MSQFFDLSHAPAWECSQVRPSVPQLILAIFILFTILASPAPAAINDTGITTCSNATQNGLPCPVTGFPGQDAEYGTNGFNFTKLDANGNDLPATATNHSCVRDNVTGLMWEVKTADGGLRDKNWTYTWYNSQSTDGNPGVVSGGTCYATGRCDTEKFTQDVNASGLCGFHDWRMPNPNELDGIVDFSIPYPGPTIDTNYFPNTLGTAFWTNSAYAGGSGHAWVVHFYDGGVSGSYRNDYDAVRLVRGGQAFLLFQDNANGTVTDNATGLMWAKCAAGRAGSDCGTGSTTEMNWGDALTTAHNSQLAGYTDWRLPNSKELQSIVDYNHFNPSINSTYFPNTSNDFFWTSSAYANDSGGAWIVGFGGGGVGSNGRAYDYAVRLVRGGTVTFSSFILTIAKSGSGAGATASNPAGIACGEICAANFPINSNVILTATPATGSVFSGWSGAGCSGTGTCTVTMTSNQTVTANFTLAAASPTPTFTARPTNTATFTPTYTPTFTPTATATFTPTNTPTFTPTNTPTATPTNVALPPTAITGNASNITATSATLNGAVKDNGATTTIVFDIGLNTNYGVPIAATPNIINANTGLTTVTGNFTGLVTCNTTYHYRVTAINSAGTENGADSNFTTLTCNAATPTPTGKLPRALIIGGHTAADDALNNNILTTVMQQAYSALIAQGYKNDSNHEYIRVLWNGDPIISLSGEALPIKPVAVADFMAGTPLSKWAQDASRLIIYMVGHGLPNLFYLDDQAHATLTSQQLNTWLNQVQPNPANAGDVTLIYDSCHSGGFLTTLKATNRVLLTSAAADQLAWFNNKGLNSYSYLLWSQLKVGKDLKEAQDKTVNNVTVLVSSNQSPQLDADGDGVANEPGDYVLIDHLCVGIDPTTAQFTRDCHTASDPLPTIQTVASDQTLTGGLTAALWLAVPTEQTNNIASAWAIITRPDLKPDNTQAFNQLPVVALSQTASSLWTGSYAPGTDSSGATQLGFNVKGKYSIVYYIKNLDGLVSAATVQTITQLSGDSLPGDADGNGTINTLDLVAIVQQILGTKTAPGNADCDGNGTVNTLDLVCVVKKILGLP